MGISDFKSAQQAHEFYNSRVIYDAWAVYSSRPPFQFLGKMNRPEGTGPAEALAAAKYRWREPAPVLVDLLAEKQDEDAAYDRLTHGIK